VAKKPKQPWEQQKGEPDSAYVRFLLYRNLGPARSLDAAYAAQSKAANGSKRRAPGAWFAESVRWHWQERACAWDIAMLAQLGQQAIVAFAAFLEALSRRALTALADPTVHPRSWEDLLHTAEVISGLIDPRAVEALLDRPSHPPVTEGILPLHQESR
jgi:hypothetical protein